MIHGVAPPGLDVVEIEHARAHEQRLDHAKILAGHQRIAERLADAFYAGIGFDLDQAALTAKAAAARHAVGLLRREGIFEADESETPDRRHGGILRRPRSASMRVSLARTHES